MGTARQLHSSRVPSSSSDSPPPLLNSPSPTSSPQRHAAAAAEGAEEARSVRTGDASAMGLHMRPIDVDLRVSPLIPFLS